MHLKNIRVYGRLSNNPLLKFKINVKIVVLACCYRRRLQQHTINLTIWLTVVFSFYFTSLIYFFFLSYTLNSLFLLLYSAPTSSGNIHNNKKPRRRRRLKSTWNVVHRVKIFNSKYSPVKRITLYLELDSWYVLCERKRKSLWPATKLFSFLFYSLACGWAKGVARVVYAIVNKSCFIYSVGAHQHTRNHHHRKRTNSTHSGAQSTSVYVNSLRSLFPVERVSFLEKNKRRGKIVTVIIAKSQKNPLENWIWVGRQVF